MRDSAQDNEQKSDIISHANIIHNTYIEIQQSQYQEILPIDQ